ncbi:DUF4347 domain-containing protein [Shewanella youngdeokensis]|uniref:DUF4347 domain-containing protein n=1 Tax=Shewanella youngdeokensis TaxID=2999068 RepID=A0ABZ0JWF2_9GAMM|nr:DUF4347 domain-containing protein [Shewanella sp. DAU334]
MKSQTQSTVTNLARSNTTFAMLKPSDLRFCKWVTYSFLLLCSIFVTSAKANEQPLKPLLLNVQSSTVLVIVDDTVQDLEGLLNSLQAEVHVLVLDASEEPFAQINQALTTEANYIGVVMVASSASGAFYLGGRWIDKPYLVEHRQSVRQFGAYFGSGSHFMILTSDSIVNPKGEHLIKLMTRLTELDISTYGSMDHQFAPVQYSVSYF